jgi:hypothetical protein
MQRYPHLSSGTTGAIGELKVSVDLMERGFELFRALSPASSCDLIASRGERFFRVEVRTGIEGTEGRVLCQRKGRYDILAVVLPDRLHYEPALDILA